MKLSSRDGAPAGSGAYTLKMDLEELQYIAALLYITRLGQGSIYKKAVRKLMATLEDELFDLDFLEQSSADVGLIVQVIAEDGLTVLQEFDSIDIALDPR